MSKLIYAYYEILLSVFFSVCNEMLNHLFLYMNSDSLSLRLSIICKDILSHYLISLWWLFDTLNDVLRFKIVLLLFIRHLFLTNMLSFYCLSGICFNKHGVNSLVQLIIFITFNISLNALHFLSQSQGSPPTVNIQISQPWYLSKTNIFK